MEQCFFLNSQPPNDGVDDIVTMCYQLADERDELKWMNMQLTHEKHALEDEVSMLKKTIEALKRRLGER